MKVHIEHHSCPQCEDGPEVEVIKAQAILREEAKETGVTRTSETRIGATVSEESSLTLDSPDTMTVEQLVDIAIQGFGKIRKYLPYIVALKRHFDDAARDDTNRLKEPIRGCYSWTEFCGMHLDRTPRAVELAFADKKKPKALPPAPVQVTADEFANYEKTLEGEKIRSTAINLLKKMEPADVVGALTGKMFGFPKPMAEAAVQIITGQPLDATSKEEPATVADVVEAVTAFMDIQVRRLSEDDAEKAYEQLKQKITNRLSIAMLA